MRAQVAGGEPVSAPSGALSTIRAAARSAGQEIHGGGNEDKIFRGCTGWRVAAARPRCPGANGCCSGRVEVFGHALPVAPGRRRQVQVRSAAGEWRQRQCRARCRQLPRQPGVCRQDQRYRPQGALVDRLRPDLPEFFQYREQGQERRSQSGQRAGQRLDIVAQRRCQRRPQGYGMDRGWRLCAGPGAEGQSRSARRVPLPRPRRRQQLATGN